MLAVGWLAGCDERPAGTAFACTCTFLTDTDVPMTFDVGACAEGAAQAPERAVVCAKSVGPGHIERCTCEPREAAAACRVGDCGE